MQIKNNALINNPDLATELAKSLPLVQQEETEQTTSDQVDGLPVRSTGHLSVMGHGHHVIIDFGQPIQSGAIAIPVDEARSLAAAIDRQARQVQLASARKRHKSRAK